MNIFLKVNNTHTDKNRVNNISKKCVCDRCQFITSKKGSLASHMKGHTECRQTGVAEKKEVGKNIYSCFQCIYYTSSDDEITKHLSTHSDSIFICGSCRRKFYSSNEYRKHLKSKKLSKSNVNEDKMSQKDFKHPDILTKTPPASKAKGVKRETDTYVEGSYIPLNISTKSHACIKCKESFADVQELYFHHISVHESEIYRCDRCEAFFFEMYRLECHRKYHHKNEQVYTCDKCCKRFVSVVAFSQHKSQHLGIQENTDS